MATTTDTLARARAAIARLREAERGATPGPWRWDATEADGWGLNLRVDDATAAVALRNAAPALLRLAEVVARLAGTGEDDAPWWQDTDEALCDYCVACRIMGGRSWNDPAGHYDDCPALAIDAALAELAELAGDEEREAGGV